MLAVGVFAQASATVVVTAPAFFIPFLHTRRGFSLIEAGTLAAAPNLGLVLTLVLWGWIVDRRGERWVLTLGMAATALITGAAVLVAGTPTPSFAALFLLFLLAGAATASANSASGRVVVGWFPRERRGLAMGIRQTCQPLGVAAAALAVPALIAGGSLAPALVLCAALVALSALLCWAVIVDPPRPPRPATEGAPAANPYRSSGVLWRIHAASALLVVPQFTLTTFGLVWLMADQGWGALAAGVLVAVAQFLGALGRIGVGVLSDRVGSRLRPLRWVAVAGILALIVMAAAGAAHWPWAVALSYVLASCIAVADNGLAFTSVAELAGPHWSGRALGAQNTGQFLAAAFVGPVIGALIAAVGYQWAFLLIALAPAAALPVVPRPAVEREPADSPA